MEALRQGWSGRSGVALRNDPGDDPHLVLGEEEATAQSGAEELVGFVMAYVR
jgi:hypothetical protein